MLARNLPGICSEFAGIRLKLGVRSEFARNSLGKRPGPAMRGTLQREILLGIWREFCTIFSEPQRKAQKFQGKLRSIFPKKDHDSHRRDRILRFLLRPEIGRFSPHFGAISLLNCTMNLEKSEKNQLENFQKNPVETAPRNCRFLSLVVVERVLSIRNHFLVRAVPSSCSENSLELLKLSFWFCESCAIPDTSCWS